MLRAALSPFPVHDTLQTQSVYCTVLTGTGWVLERLEFPEKVNAWRTVNSRASQCSLPLPPLKVLAQSITFFTTFLQLNGSSLPSTGEKFEIPLSWEELLRRTTSSNKQPGASVICRGTMSCQT